ncbi:SDR family oxidoreductase [Hymenobacter volaticus]|uniref:SDR family oxidoreductase n=1 Tax=Hymenobacter volaticus TaxID=2932254 RepID=A0ABY4G0K3_9BACT|nr:SDR family oxidoreductase [Hymenobacter volaticus]UOQ64394.1 SDR family oxidoreductase [Hymenobacter volaticus]
MENLPASASSASASRAFPTILLTGATGTIGTEVSKLLSTAGVPFRALVRSLQDPKAEQLQTLPGAELVIGDLNKPETVASALLGIERAFLLTNSSEQAETQQLAFVDMARQVGVRHLVKLSQWAADRNSPVRFLRYHAVVEEAIRATDMAYTFLRPNLFMQGLLAFRDSIRTQGQFFAAIGEAKVSVVDVRDIAAAAVAALTASGHENKIYNLTGPEALTHAQMAAQLSAALGKPIRFQDVPPEVMHAAVLEIGFPRWQADGLVEDYAHYHRGEAATVASGVLEATGQAPRPFAAFAHDYAPQFA